MSSARNAILARIRAATRDVPGDEPETWEDPERSGGPTRAPDALVDRLAERIMDYGASVTRVDEGLVADVLARILARSGARRLAVPVDLPPSWRPAGAELVADDPPLSHEALGRLDGVLTGCALAIAETGTIVLDAGGAQGRRVLTLVPDVHICVVRAEQVVADVADAIKALVATRPITFISGPSATSDIELHRVEGVHGPRRLEVLLLERT